MEKTTTTEARKEFSARLHSALVAAHLPTGPTAVARGYNLRTDGPDVTTHGVRKWLKGEAIPAHEKILVLSAWLNVHASWLRFGEHQDAASKLQNATQKNFTHDELILIHDVGSLSGPAQTVIREMVNSFLRIAAKGQEELLQFRRNRRAAKG